jgi:hypothetical protein
MGDKRTSVFIAKKEKLLRDKEIIKQAKEH